MRVTRNMDITPERGGSGAAYQHPATDATDNVRDPGDMSTDEVRQGVTGNGVRYVLAFSLGAALIALGLTWAFAV
jgi:hypothetical protein